MFDDKLTEQDLNELEEKIQTKRLSQAKAAKVVGIAQSIMCRWVASGIPLWDKYQFLRKRRQQHGYATLSATNPAGETITINGHS